MSYNLHLYFQFEEHFKLLIPIPVIITLNDRCKTRNTTVLSHFCIYQYSKQKMNFKTNGGSFQFFVLKKILHMNTYRVE